MEQRNENNIARKSFFGVLVMLCVLLCVSIVLTYMLKDATGIPIWKGILAPVLVFASGDGLSLIFLTLFILSISASFNVMGELGGVRAIVSVVVRRFESRRMWLVVVLSFVFYSFGAFLGLFEEMIPLLPIVCAICLSIGFDSFTGFLCCILSCGFGFASAITNPFTVILASDIIGVSPMEHIWFRLLIFVVMFALLQGFILLYIRKIAKKPESSLTYARDTRLKKAEQGAPEENIKDEKKLVRSYAAFLLGSLVLIIVSSLIPATRDITVVLLTAYTLMFGTWTAVYVSKDIKTVATAFLRGLAGALPAVLCIALAASIKYVFEEGRVLPIIVDNINRFTNGQEPLLNALSIFLIVLVLEFFISSSTAKALLVMGILGMVDTGFSKPMSVLLYTFGDGYTNVLFPTSPVLLISLAMLDVEYFRWVKKSSLFFLITFLVVVGFICLGIAVGY